MKNKLLSLFAFLLMFASVYALFQNNHMAGFLGFYLVFSLYYWKDPFKINRKQPDCILAFGIDDNAGKFHGVCIGKKIVRSLKYDLMFEEKMN